MKTNHLLVTALFILAPYFALAQTTTPAYESILFVADSHGTGKFGSEVDKYLRTISSKTTSVASCGSSPSNWVGESESIKSTNCGYWRKESNEKEIRVNKHKLGLLSEELKTASPQLTVVALGTNILTGPQNIDKEKASIEKMIKQIKEAKSRCLWIGPPDLTRNPFKANLESGIKEIKKVVEKNGCKFVDSTEITKYAGKDGIHYGTTQAADWGIDASEKINQQLSKLPSIKKSANKAQGSSKKVKAAN